MPPTLLAAWKAARARLESAGCSSASLDASLLVAEAAGVPRHVLRADPDRRLTAGAEAALERLLRLRARRCPVSHVLGRSEFRSLTFDVTGDVLAPRPETEALVDAACAAIDRAASDGRTGVVVDVGTGSGCIAVAVAVERPASQVVAIDASGAALDVARRNAARHGVGDRVTFLRGDLLAPAVGVVGPGRADAVVSNPPYVRRSEAGEVDPEVLWEPATAVFCDGEPAALYARIAREAAPLVRRGGSLVLELPGDGSAPVTAAVSADPAWSDVQVDPDLAGLPRVLIARRT